ncbi:UDP-glucose 4-epimerase [Candidatus Terasakiella magnetica]|uniref:UDP-glucose 4-epimerase n=1 Tax=Candidatus Terasakiella magnetica TaxID=1867952 RepID=A0A1C3RFY5_9PROT|nr:SDR family oxidoreductase [Candidatus Terasakiella magnetica]SCA56207.1 UDP-glucose 4-epimerase [Candidatus Terasakiella magnetica]
MSKILVTGATGFVGHCLCKLLIKAGHNVIAPYRSEKSDLDVNWIKIPSIDAHTNWDKKLEDVDCIIHLAARVHIMNDTCDDPLNEFRKTNVAGTRQLAQAAIQQGVKRFVFLSSIKVNGEETANDKPFTNTDTPNPQDPYGVSKMEAENMLRELESTSSLEVSIIRPPLVYGEGVKANFRSLLKLSSKGLPVPFGCLDNKRSLIHVQNLCDFIILCASHPKVAGNTYLIRDPKDISVKEMYQLMGQEAGKKTLILPFPKIVLKALGKLLGKQAMIQRLTSSLQIDLGPVITELHWKAPLNVKEAFSQTVKWYKSQANS